MSCFPSNALSLKFLPDQILSFSAGNDQNIQALKGVTEKLLNYFQLNRGQSVGQTKTAAGALAVNKFLFTVGIDNINLFRLLRSAPKACQYAIFCGCCMCANCHTDPNH